MPIMYKKTDRKDFTKLVCPGCRTRLRGVGVFKDSKIDGLTFECCRCKCAWEITTE